VTRLLQIEVYTAAEGLKAGITVSPNLWSKVVEQGGHALASAPIIRRHTSHRRYWILGGEILRRSGSQHGVRGQGGRSWLIFANRSATGSAAFRERYPFPRQLSPASIR
jgi:hypothetical protein